jgi:hypothetical protein
LLIKDINKMAIFKVLSDFSKYLMSVKVWLYCVDKINSSGQGVITHINYSGDENEEDQSSRPTWAKS